MARRKKKIVGVIKFFTVVVLLAAAGISGYFIYKYYEEVRKPSETVVTPTLPSGHGPQATQPLGGDVPGKPPQVPAVSAAEIKAGLDAARKLYSEGKFKEAVEALDRTSGGGVSVAGGDAEIEELLEEASALRDRSALFAELVEGVSEKELALADAVALVHLKNGSVIEGVIIEEDSEKVRMRVKNGIVSPFHKYQIANIEKLSPSEWRRRAREKVRKILEQSPPRSSEGLFKLAEECIEDGISDMATQIMEKALAIAPDLKRRVREEQAKRLYCLYLWYESRGVETLAKKSRSELLENYSDTPYATEARGGGGLATAEGGITGEEPVGDAERPGTGEKPPKFSSLEVEMLVAKANAKYDEGIAHLERSNPHSAAGNAENLKAFEAFKEACNLYEQALELDPKNSWIQKMLNQASQLRYLCFKRASLK